MSVTVELLDAVKKKHNLPSDYALAPMLGLTRSQVSRYRNRHDQLGDAVAVKVAHLLGVEPMEVIAKIHADKAEEPEVRAVWTGMLKTLHRAAAATVAGVILGGVCGVDGGGIARAGQLDPHSSQSKAGAPLYIMSTRRRRAFSTLARFLGLSSSPSLGRMALT